MKFLDLTGNKYGRWTVLERDMTKKGTRWICICECGNKKSINPTVLKNGHSQSCGCLWKENVIKDRIDIVGERYGKLLVIKKIDNKGYWECLCDCGNKKIIYAPVLYCGAVKSCGCLKKEMMSGSNSIFWKGGVTEKTRKIKKTPIFMRWSKTIRKNDNYTCQKCQSKEKLHAHHIINYIFDPTKALNLDNGVTLCETCHKEFHKINGKKENNLEQLNKFLNI